MDLEREIDRLYQLPLNEFTGERNALAKRAGGGAAEVRALGKPPIAAWAVNQLYWKDRNAYEALVEAAATMRAAHASVLSGKRADLRTAGKEHEDALERALRSTVALLEDSGNPVTDGTRHAIANTLRGLPSDEEPGRLTRVLQPGGFETLAGIAVKPAAKGRAAASTSARAHREEGAAKPAADDPRAREAVEAAARALKIAEQNARREEFEAARAAREADKAARALESARAELDAARRAVDEAEKDQAAAERRREQAGTRARESEAAVTAARAALAAAEQAIGKRKGARR